MLTPQRGCFKSDGSWDSDVTVNILRFNFMFALVNTALALDGGQCWSQRGAKINVFPSSYLWESDISGRAHFVEKKKKENHLVVIEIYVGPHQPPICGLQSKIQVREATKKWYILGIFPKPPPPPPRYI